MIGEPYKVHFVFFKQKDILIDEEISDPWNFAEKLSDSLKLLLTIPMKKRKAKEKVDQGMKKTKKLLNEFFKGSFALHANAKDIARFINVPVCTAYKLIKEYKERGPFPLKTQRTSKFFIEEKLQFIQNFYANPNAQLFFVRELREALRQKFKCKKSSVSLNTFYHFVHRLKLTIKKESRDQKH